MPMFPYQSHRLAKFCVGFAFLCASPAFAQQGDRLTPDAPAQIAGVESVCTGVGLDARQDPRWSNYSLKVEIAGPGGQYLGDEHLVLRQAGKDLLALTCDGPWVLFQLPAGRYEVEARVGNQRVSSAAFAPASGQGRIILRFQDGGSP
jgi:hypothetical protein